MLAGRLGLFIVLTSEKLLQLVTGTPKLSFVKKKKKKGKSDGEYSHIRKIIKIKQQYNNSYSNYSGNGRFAPTQSCFAPTSSRFVYVYRIPSIFDPNSIWKQWMKSHFVEMPLQIPIY